MSKEPENFDVMNEFYKLLLEALRRSGITVIIMAFACFVLWTMLEQQRNEYRGEMMSAKKEWSQMITELRYEVKDCDTERRALSQEVSMLRERINIMAGFAPKSKR